MKKVFTCLLLGLLTSSVITISAQSVIRVDAAANGMNDGTSWENAYTDLQDALNSASASAVDTIWVAEGTYLPDTINGASSATFAIPSDLVLLGGFPSGGGLRNPEAHPTVLSGDLNNNDVDDDFANFRSDNVHTVVTITLITNAPVIDGFTIRNGHAAGEGMLGANGGGIYSTGAPTIRHCTFEQNYASGRGGAIYQMNNFSAPLVLENSLFQHNSANGGMGVYLINGRFDFDHCVLQNNIAHGDLPNGSTVHIVTPRDGTIRNTVVQANVAGVVPGLLIWQLNNDPAVSVEILDCSFIDNTVMEDLNTTNPAGMLLVTSNALADFTIKGCTYTGNNSLGSGSAMALLVNPNAENASFLIDSCLFSENTAKYNGSAIYTNMSGDNTNLEIKRSQFLDNVTSGGGAGAIDLWSTSGGTGTTMIDDCYFEGNLGGADGALEIGNLHNGGAFMDFYVKNSEFRANEATDGGAIRVTSNEESQTDVVIENCAFYENIGTEQGGALNINPGNDALIKLVGCTIDNNSSPEGGAVFVKTREAGNVEVVMENSLITHNNGESAAIFVDSIGHLSLVNCTVADNASNGIEVTQEGYLELQNTILHNNGTANFQALTNDVTISSAGGNLFGDDSFSAYVQLSDLTNDDPLFYGQGDPCDYYQLTADSPALNSGEEWADAPDLDGCGDVRVVGGQIDMGALEAQIVSTTEILVEEAQLSPNPASDFVYLSFPEGIAGPLDVRLFDAQGKFVQQQAIYNGQALSLAGLANGMYLIKIDLLDNVMIGRFVKQ